MRISQVLRLNDPNLIPARVRLFLAVHWLAGGLGMVWMRPTLYAGAATTGILLGLVGSGALLWETTVNGSEAIALEREVFRSGSGNNLSVGEVATVALFTIVILLFSLVLSPAVVLNYKHTNDMQHAIYSVLLLIGYPAAAMGAMYLCIKVPRKWMTRRADEIRAAESPERRLAVIKSILRSVGFTLIWMGALLQIPLTIKSS